MLQKASDKVVKENLNEKSSPKEFRIQLQT